MGAAEEESLQALPPKMPEPSNIKDDDTDVPTRKPGSKGPGRKRTKTGCLSRLEINKLSSSPRLPLTNTAFFDSLSKETHQVWRGETNMPELHKI
jgi:hypothetical protein